jgi:hypothetical protein
MLPYKLKAILFSLCVVVAVSGQAAWSITQSAVQINSGAGPVTRAGSRNAQALPAFANAYFGNFSTGGTLVLNGGYMRTQKTASSNVCLATMYYRVYRSGDVPGAWQAISLPTITTPIAGTEQRTNLAANINLLSGLTPATYFLEVKWGVTGHATCSTCCTQTLVDDNGGNGFRAYFDYSLFDSFTDGNFTSSPVWSGNTSAFRTNTSTSAASGASNSFSIRMRAPNTTGSEYMSAPNTVWSPTEQHWSFWIGRRSQSYDAANALSIWLYANESNLESATVDGYRVVIGDNSGGDEFVLQSVTNGVGTNVLSSAAMTNNLTDIGVALHVRRTTGGSWTLYTSPLPTSNGGGVNAYVSAETSATVNHGSATNTVYTPAGTGYFGIVALHTTSTNSRRTVEFDAINLRAVFPLQTQVNFVSTNTNTSETSGSINLTVGIVNPSPLFATTATVTLTSGTGSRVNGFTSQTVTFPANSSANQNVTITITNNVLCDDLENMVFTISAASGGTSAVVNTPSQNTIALADDDMEYPIFVSDDAESGLSSNWTIATPGSWTANALSAINGINSLRHTDTGAAGQSWISLPTDDQPLSGAETIWQFNISHFQNEPDPNDKFLIFLAANEANLYSNTVDGYAVGVNPATAIAPDLITLWRVVDGLPTAAIVTSAIDLGNTHDVIGYKISRTEDGLWKLELDIDGDFENLVSAGTGTDVVYKELSYFGMRYLYKNTTSGDLSMDDLTITQRGCKCTYFSQSSGNVNAAIWSKSVVGAPGFAKSSRYANMVVRSTHTVNMNDSWLAKDFTVETNAVLNQGTSELSVFNQLNSLGTWNSDDGTLRMKGNVDQTMTLSAPITLNHLIIDNDGQDVSLSSLQSTIVKGTVSCNEGILYTNDKLVLLSNISGTGSIAEIQSTSDLIGKVTIERYIPQLTNYPYGSWALLGSPVQGATINDWNDDIQTTGFIGADNPPPYAFNNVQYYNEGVAGAMNNGYVPATNVNNAIDPARGYALYLQTAAQIIDVTGDIYKNSFNQPLSYTNTGSADDGWNLLVNQYPAQVDFRELVLNGSGIASYYLFDAESNNYKVYNGISQTGTAPRYVNSSQAFFAKATSTGAFLRYQENFKSNAAVSFERSDEENSFFSFSMTSFNQTSDECIVLFDPNATSNYEWEMDAEKLFSPNPNAVNCAIVSADNIYQSIDSRPYAAENATFPVFVSFPLAGDYALLITDINNLPTGTCLYMEDMLTGDILPVSNGANMTIHCEGPYSGNRFLIHTSPAAILTTMNETCYQTNNGTIDLTIAAGEWNVVLEGEQGIVLSGTNPLHIENLEAGNYSLYVTSANEQCQSDVLPITISQPEQEVYTLLNAAVDECGISGHGTIEFSFVGIPFYEYEVRASDQTVVNSGLVTEPNVLIEQLHGDVYEVEIHSNCTTETFEVNIKDPNAVTVSIFEDEINVNLIDGLSQLVAIEQSSTNADSYHWSLDSGVDSYDETFIHEFEQTGTYTLMLLASNDFCSDADFIQINVNGTVQVKEMEPAPYVSFTQREEAINFTFHQLSSAFVKTQLYDMSGKLVRTLDGQASSGSAMTLEIASLPAGAYTAIVLVNDLPLLSRKMIK